MRVSHEYTVVFGDPNLVSCASLAPVLQLAERAGLQDLAAGQVRVDKPGGGNARRKVPALVAGMIAGGQQQRRCDIGADALDGGQGRGDLLGDALEP